MSQVYPYEFLQEEAQILRKIADSAGLANKFEILMDESDIYNGSIGYVSDPSKYVYTRSRLAEGYDDDGDLDSVSHSYAAAQQYMLDSYKERASLDAFDEEYRPDLALRNLGAVMSERLQDSLAKLDEHSNTYIPDSNFIKDVTFDGYYNNEDGAAISDSKKVKHAYFNMGLGLGESKVVNPLFQFHDNDDTRTHPLYTKVGRIFADTVLANQLIASFIPGSIKYNTNVMKMISIDGGRSNATANYIRSGGVTGIGEFINAMWMGVTSIASVVGSIGAMAFGSSRLVEFKATPRLFKRYFNNIIKNLGVNMGIVGSDVDGYAGRHSRLTLDTILPGRMIKRHGYSFLGSGWASNEMIHFRCTKVGSSESFSNSNTTNPLMEELNAQSEESRSDINNGGINSAKNMLSSVADIFGGATGGNSQLAMRGMVEMGKNMWSKVGKGVSEMQAIKGGAMNSTLPDIYQSSSFQREYSFEFVNHSPYGSRLSIFENTYIPTILHLCLALPRQVGSMSYIEPFAVRVCVPGEININTGIMQGISIARGEGDNEWTKQKLPKTIKVTLDIKDTEPMMTLPLGSRLNIFKNLFENVFPSSGMSEYLACMSGFSLEEQMDWKKAFVRGWDKWKLGLQQMVHIESIESAIMGVPIFRNISRVFGMAGLDDISFDEQDSLETKFLKDGVLELRNKSKDFVTPNNNAMPGVAADSGYAEIIYPSKALHKRGMRVGENGKVNVEYYKKGEKYTDGDLMYENPQTSADQ